MTETTNEFSMRVLAEHYARKNAFLIKLVAELDTTIEQMVKDGYYWAIWNHCEEFRSPTGKVLGRFQITITL